MIWPLSGNHIESRPVVLPERHQYQMIQTTVFSCQSVIRIFMTISVFVASANAIAQQPELEEKVRGKVIGRLWHSQINGSQFFSYTRQLTEELDLPTSPIMMMMGGGAVGGGLMNSIGTNPFEAQRATSETRGTLIFLESSPTPGTPRFISFRSVKDLKEYQKIMKSRSGGMMGGGELIGEDDRHEVKVNLMQLVSQSPTPNPDEADGDKPRVMSFSIRIDSSIGEGDLSELPEPAEMPTSFSTYYRYHDGFMYTGQLEALHTIDLPSGRSLTQTDEEAADSIRGQIDLREIPRLLKQQLWTSLQTRAMTYLQRFDNENVEDHAMRSAVGKGRLELLKAAMFDVDQINFSVVLPKEKTDSIKLSLEAEARDESQLASTMSQIARSPSALTQLRDADSPLMISSTLDVPDWMKPLAVSFSNSLQARMKESAGDDTVAELIDHVFRPISDTLQKGQFDAIVRMEGTAATGSDLIGGIKLVDSENFRTALETLLLVQPASDDYQLSQSKAGERSVLTLSTSADFKFKEGNTSIPVTIHLAGQDGYLWFAIGGPSSLKTLTQQLETAPDTVRTTGIARPLEVRLKLSEWLGSESEGFSGLPEQLLQQLERTLSEVLDQGQTMSISMNGKPQEIETEKKFTSYASKVLKDSGTDFELQVQTSGRRLTAEALVGTQVVKFLVAQYVVAQNRMFQNISFDLPNIEGLGEGDGTQIRSIRIGR